MVNCTVLCDGFCDLQILTMESPQVKEKNLFSTNQFLFIFYPDEFYMPSRDRILPKQKCEDGIHVIISTILWTLWNIVLFSFSHFANNIIDLHYSL